jgi:hypothetical protein
MVNLKTHPSLWLSEKEFELPLHTYELRVLNDKGEALKIDNTNGFKPHGTLKFFVKPFHFANTIFGQVLPTEIL